MRLLELAGEGTINDVTDLFVHVTRLLCQAECVYIPDAEINQHYM